MGLPVKLTIPSDTRYLLLTRNVLRDFLCCAGITEATAAKLVLSVDEACSNIVKYAYDGRSDEPIELAFSFEDNLFVATIRDYGKPCEKGMVKPRALDEIKPGGLGSHLIFCIMDSVDYNTDFEKGTLLTMKKRIDNTDESQRCED